MAKKSVKKDAKLSKFGKSGQRTFRAGFKSEAAYRAHMSKMSKDAWERRRKLTVV